MESDSMKKALQSRRGKGIDISVILGPAADQSNSQGVLPTGKEYEEDRKSDLAPPSMDPMGHSPLSEMKDSDLLDGMSDYDKSQASSERAPRSLGERARRDMIMSATQQKK